MNKEHCPFCGEQAMTRDTQPMTYTYRGQSVILQQPGRYCNDCEESILDPKDLKATRQALATFKAGVDRLLAPAEIKAIRKQLHLSQKDAAAICGGGKNAFSRYESGEVIIPRAASNLLRLLGKHKNLINEVEPDESMPLQASSRGPVEESSKVTILRK